jgi:hypothetical protein
MTIILPRERENVCMWDALVMPMQTMGVAYINALVAIENWITPGIKAY